MKKIIIVDDNITMLALYKAIIKQYGKDIKAEYFSDAEMAMKRVIKNSFDLIVCDVNLKHPKLDGFKIARIAYAQGKPIIFVTGTGIIKKMQFYTLYPDMISSAKYMIKPIKSVNFIDNVNELLARGVTSNKQMFERIIA